jgi:hypothetical protein
VHLGGPFEVLSALDDSVSSPYRCEPRKDTVHNGQRRLQLPSISKLQYKYVLLHDPSSRLHRLMARIPHIVEHVVTNLILPVTHLGS